MLKVCISVTVYFPGDFSIFLLVVDNWKNDYVLSVVLGVL